MTSVLTIFNHLYIKSTLLFNTTKGIAITVAVTTLFGCCISTPLLLLIFFIWLLIDFITGCLASYIEIKNGSKELPKSGYFFESDKARESGVKLVGYLTVFFFVYMTDSIFFNKTFEIVYLSNKNLTLTETVICGAIAIEAYSAVVENLKMAGFDILGKIGKMSDSIWLVINKIKGNNNAE